MSNSNTRDMALRMSRARKVFTALPEAFREAIPEESQSEVLRVIANKLVRCDPNLLAAEIARVGEIEARREITHPVGIAKRIVDNAARKVAPAAPDRGMARVGRNLGSTLNRL